MFERDYDFQSTYRWPSRTGAKNAVSTALIDAKKHRQRINQIEMAVSRDLPSPCPTSGCLRRNRRPFQARLYAYWLEDRTHARPAE